MKYHAWLFCNTDLDNIGHVTSLTHFQCMTLCRMGFWLENAPILCYLPLPLPNNESLYCMVTTRIMAQSLHALLHCHYSLYCMVTTLYITLSLLALLYILVPTRWTLWTVNEPTFVRPTSLFSCSTIQLLPVESCMLLAHARSVLDRVHTHPRAVQHTARPWVPLPTKNSPHWL